MWNREEIQGKNYEARGIEGQVRLKVPPLTLSIGGKDYEWRWFLEAFAMVSTLDLEYF